jgi:predicted SAM-dependent methyltransferase
MSAPLYCVAPTIRIAWKDGVVRAFSDNGRGIETWDWRALNEVLTAFLQPKSINDAWVALPSWEHETFRSTSAEFVRLGLLVPVDSPYSQSSACLACYANALEVARLSDYLTTGVTSTQRLATVTSVDFGICHTLFELIEIADTLLRPNREAVDVEPPLGCRLNLGAGRMRIQGWTSVDVGGDPDIHSDLRRPLPVRDGTVAEVYMSFVLEHLAPGAEVGNLLREVWRVLQPQGRLRVAVPDAEKWLRAYVHKDEEFFSEVARVWPHWPVGLTRLATMLQYLGGYSESRTFDTHKGAYDFETLVECLKASGFVSLVRSEFMGSCSKTLRIDSFSALASVTKDVNRFVLYVEAVKP